MAEIQFTSQSAGFNVTSFNGGLNSTAGPLALQDNESSDLQNIDFSTFGSILKRNGYTALNTSAISGSPDIDGLHWYEYDSSGTTTRHLIATVSAKVLKMDDLDGTWDDITGALTITAGYHCDFENFLNEVYATNGEDLPFKWTGTGNAAVMDVPTNLTKAKYVKQYNNYLFLANVLVDGTAHPSRLYWSDIKDTTTWGATHFIEVAKNDGQEITGIKVLADRLVIYKTRSIYNLLFTGDADIPFILPGGGKTNSAVGCIAPFSIQEVKGGHVFLSYDGFYFFDGNNSYKISDKITTTLLAYNTTQFTAKARSLVQHNKNRYWCSLPSSGQTENDRVFVWDFYHNAWSIYTGMAPSAMTTAYVSGIDERPYWGDYAGFVYRGDTGADDYPLNVQTAISAYYYTNWRVFQDLTTKKGVPHVYIYFQFNNSTLTFAYSYDFEYNDQYSQTFSMSTSTDVYGVGLYGTARYASDGGSSVRRDLIGRGRVIRIKFANSTLSEEFRIDGLGLLAHLETDT